MKRQHHQDIRIGTLVLGDRDPARYIQSLLPHGFESFSLTWQRSLGETDLPRMAEEVRQTLGHQSQSPPEAADSDDMPAVISTLGLYGNPLMDRPQDEQTRHGLALLIDNAHLFGCDVVSAFTGRLIDKPIDQCIERFAQVWQPLAQRAADRGVRIAFENCAMDGDWRRGDWNIAHNPKCWDMMFNAIPMDNIGLQWEPCHQMVSLIEPLPQIRQYAPRIFNVHGKDATIRWDIVRTEGVHGPTPYVFHRTPGFGDSNWSDIITELRLARYRGTIDIEGWHDPVYRADLETTGQVHALNHLKRARGGMYVPNP